MTLNLGKGSEEERKPELWVSGGVKGGGGRMAREPRPRSVVRPATRVARTRIRCSVVPEHGASALLESGIGKY